MATNNNKRPSGAASAKPVPASKNQIPTKSPTSAKSAPINPPRPKPARVSTVRPRGVGANSAKVAERPIPAGLRVPSLNGEHRVRSDATERFLATHNDYYATLASPATVIGVRIPDASVSTTATVSILTRVNVPVNANGIAAIQVGWWGDFTGLISLIPGEGPVTVGDTTTQGAVMGCTNHTAATATQLFSKASGAAGSQPVFIGGASTVMGSVRTMCNEVRLVSAGLSFVSTAGAMANEGMYTAVSLPRDFWNDNELLTGNSWDDMTLIALQNAPGAIVEPISKGEGVSLTYTPADNVDFEYKSLMNVTQAHESCEMFAVASGAEPDSVIAVTIVINYEAIPNSDTISFVDTGLSFDDPIALAEAINAREMDDLAISGTPGFNGLHPAMGGSHGFSTLPEAQSALAAKGGGVIMTPSVVLAKTRTASSAPASAKRRPQRSLFRSALRILLPMAAKFAPLLLEAL